MNEYPKFRKMSYDQLGEQIDKGETRTTAWAMLESNRRLQSSNTVLSWVNVALAFAAVIFAAVQYFHPQIPAPQPVPTATTPATSTPAKP
jgi:hypothetical protein